MALKALFEGRIFPRDQFSLLAIPPMGGDEKVITLISLQQRLSSGLRSR
jgi:hypothetical protein